jgi:Fe2+ transport system protein FeoA
MTERTVMHPSLHMPLSAVPTGRAVVLRRVREFNGLVSRLAAMGFVPGVMIDVHQNDRIGPVIVGLKDSRVMLGRDTADRMAVE